MSKAIFCTVSTIQEAESLLNLLQTAGIPSKDVSVLFADRKETQRFIHEKNTKAPEGAMAGAGTGGVVGGILGWLAGIGSLAIPGIGPFIAAGPILAALSGSAIGATLGGVIGSLVGLGMPEIEAKKYEQKLKDGGILVAAHVESDEDVKNARQVFKDAGVTDVAESEEIVEVANEGYRPVTTPEKTLSN